MALTVADAPEHADGLFTLTVGNGSKVTVPLALTLEHVVVVLVMITLYVPAIVVVKLATLPGLVAAAGTVQA